ncbi:MAG: hypothetical protein NZ519_08255 [Bacteroidia bacterium]|nr:hypothetical protein [Bacteroidia bacterium]MDW8301535.1 hypothetical protein [Bacteroidia bacterium]
MFSIVIAFDYCKCKYTNTFDQENFFYADIKRIYSFQSFCAFKLILSFIFWACPLLTQGSGHSALRFASVLR